VDVDATVISVKGMRITRGDLPICEARKKNLAELTASRGVVRGWQKSAEGIVGLGSVDRRPERVVKERKLSFRW
jgi:hypothetical protein